MNTDLVPVTITNADTIYVHAEDAEGVVDLRLTREQATALMASLGWALALSDDES